MNNQNLEFNYGLMIDLLKCIGFPEDLISRVSSVDIGMQLGELLTCTVTLHPTKEEKAGMKSILYRDNRFMGRYRVHEVEPIITNTSQPAEMMYRLEKIEDA